MTLHPTTPRRTLPRPSPIFLALVAAALLSGFALWNGIGPVGIVTFLFVVVTWVITLSLHEFAHAAIAYRYGDTSVLFRGYLTLNPLKYTHVLLSIVLPLIFLVLGGIGLPGGAVFIDRRALRTRFAHSAVSAGGPLTNLAIAIALGIAVSTRSGNSAFWAAIAFLAFLQLTAAVLNLIPVPGLDGYGIVEQYLPMRWRLLAARVAPFAVLVLFGLLLIPQLNIAFFGGIRALSTLMGVPEFLVGAGFSLFRFWQG